LRRGREGGRLRASSVDARSVGGPYPLSGLQRGGVFARDAGGLGMKVLGSRVDALTLAFRVRLDPSFVAKLKERGEVARQHGRAAFQWTTLEPDTAMGSSTERRLGPHRQRWADDYERSARVARLWGEMAYSAQRGVWRITNEPYFRIQVKEHAEGGGQIRDCGACHGTGWCSPTNHAPSVLLRERCPRCDGATVLEDPGWTLEIIWYAQELARVGLANVLRESEAIASMTGEVLESRLRRLDLCADVEGWEIRTEDVKRLAKRPRARWSVDDAGPSNDVFEPTGPEPPKCTRTGACKERCTCNDVNTYGSGSVMAQRRITGISVGRGGAFMSRIYDKRAELERDSMGERRAAEEERWTAAGWDGESAVARVEFQIRGVALVELGIRDPDACVVPVMRHEAYTDRRGKRRVRAVVMGHRVLTAQEDGREVQATIVHRLEAVWRTCLDWVRLVVPAFSRNGRPKPVSRLEDDPRWALLRTVSFDETRAAPIKRYRPRAAATAAQALGVCLSQAGRANQLTTELPEEVEAYGTDEALIEAMLRSKLAALFSSTAEHVTTWMIERFGGAAEAAAHYAIRHNAARARFLAGADPVVHQEARPPPEAKVA
jgi:hypothetical protein